MKPQIYLVVLFLNVILFTTKIEARKLQLEEIAGCADFQDRWMGFLIDELQKDPDLRILSQENISSLPVEWRQELLIAEKQIMAKLPSNKKLRASFLAEVEVGDRSTKEKRELLNQLKVQFQKLRDLAEKHQLSCQDEIRIQSTTPISAEQFQSNGIHPIVTGALRAMVTAYQSCAPLQLDPVDRRTPNLVGITKIGPHDDGVGQRRKITDLAGLLRTQPYLKSGVVTGPNCFDITKSPLIYDYGGKPDSSSNLGAPLNFFKNAGYGEPVLGVDCSGYVFTALAAAGLRVTAGKPIRGSQVMGIYAALYMNPQDNGLTCLKVWKPTREALQVQSGDILASQGHVVILDVRSEDPLGLGRARSLRDCTNSNLNAAGFDFEVLQSAPVKEGIGLVRFKAADYLTENEKMRSGLESYAVSACKVRYGGSADATPSVARIARHLMTQECSDERLPLVREACVEACY